MFALSTCLPCVGGRATIIPYILIGAAVVLVVGFVIFQMVRKKDDAEEIDEINLDEINDTDDTEE